MVAHGLRPLEPLKLRHQESSLEILHKEVLMSRPEDTLMERLRQQLKELKEADGGAD